MWTPNKTNFSFVLGPLSPIAKWPNALENIKFLCGINALEKSVALRDWRVCFSVGDEGRGEFGAFPPYSLNTSESVCKDWPMMWMEKKSLDSGTYLPFSHSKAFLLWPATSNVQPPKQKRSTFWLSWSLLWYEGWITFVVQDKTLVNLLFFDQTAVQLRFPNLGYNQEHCWESCLLQKPYIPCSCLYEDYGCFLIWVLSQ